MRTFSQLKSYLEQPVDNSSLVIFRIAFGFLIAAESFGAIFTGWVKRAFIDPEFTFTFIGFEWLQPLPGYGMYGYYALMGCAGVLVMFGWRYRLSLAIFAVMWTATYLMQKTNYNNHYYLLILLCFLMLLLPANKNGSLDVKLGYETPEITCPRWAMDLLKWQLLIVYTYAALAKLYPGWLEGEFISISFANKADYPLIGPWLQHDWVQKVVMIGGILYDLTIIPIMYWPPTRKFGLWVSIGFHMFNSIVFGIGIFPYLMMASLVLFYNTRKWRTRIPWYQVDQVTNPSNDHIAPQTVQRGAKTEHFKLIFSVLAVYFLLQLWLPVRHHFIAGDVFRTEEWHRMAWRMMLRSKYGTSRFTVINRQTGEKWVVDPKDYLTNKQAFKMAGRPDMIWQFAQYLQKVYAAQGINDIQIYATTRAHLNKKLISKLVDPEVDLLSVPWKRFGHNPWIVAEE